MEEQSQNSPQQDGANASQATAATPAPVAAPSATPNTSAGEQNKTLFGILAYLGPLVIVSYLADNKDSFVKFHIKQGLVLFGAEVVVWILSGIFWHFWFIINLINLATFILSIIGIVNVVQGKEKELPLVGHLGSNINI